MKPDRETKEKAAMNNETLNTQLFSLEMRQDGIVCQTWMPNIKIDLAAAKKSVAAVKVLCQDEHHPLLFDMRAMKNINREARAYFFGPEAEGMSAVALLVDSAVGQIIANFIIQINKPTTPTRLFTSEAEAVEWLKGFLE